MKSNAGLWLIAGLVLAFRAEVAISATVVAGESCNARLDVTVGGGSRSAALSSADCQERGLSSAEGFSLNTTNPADGTTEDSSSMVAAGGELYEAFVGGARDAAVLLTPNRAFMMSRTVAGN